MNNTSNDNTVNTERPMLTFNPAMTMLTREQDDTNVRILSSAIIGIIEDSVNKKDMERSIGTVFTKRRLERELYRRFPIFKELSKLSLLNIDFEPVNVDNEFLLSITVSFPPTTTRVITPSNYKVASIIQGWTLDNNFHNVCPIIIVNSETFFMSV